MPPREGTVRDISSFLPSLPPFLYLPLELHGLLAESVCLVNQQLDLLAPG